ncbi:MAG: 5-formyltetrahydrofolate cyclo-ligase [Catenulispora sp.]|nr:5-formyltetrahydrofolate cyclo-ligase [Catenulispora sp.]
MTNQSNEPGGPKGTIRSRLLAARRACAPEQRARWSAAACEVLLERIGDARTVAAYASFGTEPDTGPLLAALLERGVRVLLPILENDMSLSWGRYSGSDSLVRRIPPGGTRPGPIAEPAESLGPEAVLTADWIVVPALAVSPCGVRMGRGGGSYDRTLAAIEASGGAARPRIAALLYPGEVGVDIPVEPHDRPVDVAVTADEVHDWRESPGRFPRA